MNEALFEKLKTGLRQAKAIRAGTLQPSRRTTLTRDHPAAVRTRLGKTQEEFAAMIGVPVGTLRNWEQGHRAPTGPAKALLIAAARYPKEIADALAEAARGVKEAVADVGREARRVVNARSGIGPRKHSRSGGASTRAAGRTSRVRDRQPASVH